MPKQIKNTHEEEKVDFGYTQVSPTQKTHLVQQVFSQVANNYDLMNNIMSFGLHHLWKDKVIAELRPRPDDILLDVAGGTADIATRFLKAGGGKVIVSDLNQEMLQHGQAKAATQIYRNQMQWVCANAEALPFADNSFDYYTISFGIRNVTNKLAALQEANRVLKPGGKFICLEFSHVDNNLINKLYDWYAFTVIPQLGKTMANNKAAYQYLSESIKQFPSAGHFAAMMEEAGLQNVTYQKFTFGVVAIHIGYCLMGLS